MTQLQKLVQHRDALLLAEAIGWLHDYRKCSEEQLRAQSANVSGQGVSRTELTTRFANLNSVSLTISSITEQITDLLNQPKGQAGNPNAPILQQYLSRCHNTAHFDKQDPLDSSKQNYPGTQISTAFGFEVAVSTGLTTQLWALPWNDLTTFGMNNRNQVYKVVQSLFATVGADTRRPINEISLWDWGMLVGALYKTTVAAILLNQQPANRDLRWRLLSVRTNALDYLTNVSRLPDLIERQNRLQIAIKNVQTLLEEVYSLATEVYRDENGSLYVVPDLSNLLDLQGEDDQTLRTYIQQQFTTDDDVVPQIMLAPNAWWGQDPDRLGRDEIPPARAMLSSPTSVQSDIAAISEAWKGEKQPICPVCGLRPCINGQLDYCQVCGERRKGRVHEWLLDHSKTIWLDEVADANGRLTLVTGTFDLTNWLDGSFVQTLLVQEPTVSNLPVTKTPSFARLRRVWQTTKIFWQETQSDTDKHLRDARRRLLITLANQPDLTQYQVYELDLLGSTRMSVLWDGNHLISTDNLSYTAVQLGIKREERKTPADAALAVGAWLDENKQKRFQLISDDEKNRQFNIQIADVDYQDAAYATTIPILAEPRTFMALVPADKALAVLDAIKTKYEREMGKVRNRLPLHLGAVYFHRRTPLRAALDAGRRMLKYEGGKMKDEPWIVQQDAQKGSLPAEQKRLQEQEKGQFTQTILVQLQQADRSLTWHVPAVMGDGSTPDNWYPYVFIHGDVSSRPCVFKGLRPQHDGTAETCWLIHAAELKAGDQVYFTPATFDFEWLDHSGRRFEIAYDKTGQRHNRTTRPYLLDDMKTIKQVWRVLAGENGLTNSQIYALRDLVEAKREEWGAGETFDQLCRDAVRNAQWKNRQAIDVNLITTATQSGLLTDIIQLYMGIMKEKPQRTKEDA